MIKERNFKPVNCVDCGLPFERINSKQKRCPDCQAIKRKDDIWLYNRKHRKKKGATYSVYTIREILQKETKRTR